MRTGFEVELLAPEGCDRGALAAELAQRSGGSVRRVFHADSEPSSAPGARVFHHLSLGFEVRDAGGDVLARLVDDTTISADLAADAGPGGPAGGTGADWYRVVSDDVRLLRLVAHQADAQAPLARVLEPVAQVFGVGVELLAGAARVEDAAGATVALAAPATAGRERVCEVVTPPLVGDVAGALEHLLAPARRCGFVVPVEAAVHLHVDGAPFRQVDAFTSVVLLFAHWRSALWRMLGTNSACRRLGPLPEELVDLVQSWPRSAAAPGWEEVQRVARAAGVTQQVSKYADVNLTQLLSERPVRDTLEVRILPGSLDTHEILRRTALVHALLERCTRGGPLPPADSGTAAALDAQLADLAEGRA